jgi:DNA-directed RNA polymerase subunit RPC12/RpoP
MDFILLGITIGLSLLLATILCACAVIDSKAFTVNCPKCGQRIPKSAIRVTGVRCHRCDWRVVASDDELPPQLR